MNRKKEKEQRHDLIKIISDIGNKHAQAAKGKTQHAINSLVEDILASIRNPQSSKNGAYLFAVKSQAECLSGDWDLGVAIAIVHKDFWKKNHCLNDTHISYEIDLPEGFGEEGESLFSYSEEDVEEVEAVVAKLKEAGFQHSPELDAWWKHHDP